ncbi:MAG: class I SAM-dependent methyltransferase [Candidatus Bathyarchaeia archaeon]|jgi:malonyl-CoA O-methyltransferase
MSAWTDKRRVKDCYDATAAGYNELYGEEQRRKYQRALQNVETKRKTVLDVGCGSGLFFSQVAGQAELVVGVDDSRNLLTKAKEHGRGFGNVNVILADADHLPLRSGFFGAVFAFTVLQNLPAPQDTLAELKRVTSVGGRVVVTGLKRAFALDRFMDLLEASVMRLDEFVDEEAINCYIAALTA